MKIKKSTFFKIYSMCTLFAATIRAHDELPLVITICSYNAAPYVEQNLDSIFMQQYENFRVVYIDDASADGTADLVEHYIEKHRLHHKLTIQKNSERCRKLKNIYTLFHSFDDEEIIIQIDGDDWLAHDQVFSIINKTYQENDVWLTYGQFIGHDNSIAQMCKPVPLEIIEHRDFKSWEWVYSHVRTFKAWLFKNIPLKELINTSVPGFKGKFYPVANDMITMFSMLEMCGNKFAFIPDILYIYNRGNPFHTGKHEGKLYAPAKKELRSRPKLTQIKRPLLQRLNKYKNAKVDCILLVENPHTIQTTLDTFYQSVHHINTLILVCDQCEKVSSLVFASNYSHHNIEIMPVRDFALDNLNLNEHILLMRDSIKLTHAIHCNYIIGELERTFAYAWYCTLSQDFCVTHNIATQHIVKNLYAWKYLCDKQGIINLHNFDGSIYRTTDFKKSLINREINSIADLQEVWKLHKASLDNMGLFENH